MNLRMLSPGNVAAAAVLIGGALVVAMPRQATSVVQLVLLTIAAATVLHAVGSIVPEWTATVWSPFDRRVRRAGDVPGSAEIGRIRARMSGRRQRIADGRWLPPETLRLLHPLIGVALERDGLGWGDGAHEPGDAGRREAAGPGATARSGPAASATGRSRPSPLTRAVLTTAPLPRSGWIRTRRPDARQVAALVHAVLDDLDSLSTDRGAHEHAGPRSHLEPGQPT